MSDPFVGEIRMFGFDYVPSGWARCDGQTLPISQNTALFALIGTLYGGNGATTFALPDLRGRVPLGQGDAPTLSAYEMGEAGGDETVGLTSATMPRHTHVLSVSGEVATEREPPGQLLAAGEGVNFYDTTAPAGTMAGGAVANAGTSVRHNNLQPYNTLLCCIAMAGTFPTRG